MKITVQEIAKVANADVIQNGSVAEITSVSIDTRTLKAGDLFIAIKGPHFDGHEFMNEAISKGACGIVQSEKRKAQSGGIWEIAVDDTTHALGDIAACWRKKVFPLCIAVTGSNGKSTTKEMIASSFSATRRVIKTEGNFNNLIGLPLQVLKLEPSHEVAIFEMGMSAEREIKRLTEIAMPDIGLITNINPAHLEKLHTVENVARAKGELFTAMRKDGTAVVNAEDPWAVELGKSYSGKKITYGMQNDCDVRFGRMISENLDKTDLTFYVGGREYAARLPVPGVHNVMNALAAVAVGVAAGVKVITMIPGLESFSAMRMRMEHVQLLNGIQLVNDSYNANPSSMYAALRTVGAAKKAGRFIAVLGEMLGLGEVASEKHRELGTAAAEFGVSRLFVTGEHASDVKEGAASKGLKDASVLGDIEKLKKAVLDEIRTGDVVLIKGSRGMQMERVAEYLKNKVGV